MPRVLSDAEIADLLRERKPITKRYRSVLHPRKFKKGRTKELGRKLNLTGENGNRFRIFVKTNPQIINNFSIGLVWVVSKKEKYLLIRCNGFHEEHVNKIEKIIIPADTCHIHYRTERYDKVKTKDLGYAEDASIEFRDRKSALEYFVTSFGFYILGKDEERQLSLFDN